MYQYGATGSENDILRYFLTFPEPKFGINFSTGMTPTIERVFNLLILQNLKKTVLRIKCLSACVIGMPKF